MTENNNRPPKVIRKMTMSEQRALFEILDGRSSHGEVLKSHGEGVYSYMGDWSDAKISLLINPALPATVVAYRRIEAYGPLPDAMPSRSTLLHRVERIEEVLCKLHTVYTKYPQAIKSNLLIGGIIDILSDFAVVIEGTHETLSDTEAPDAPKS